MSEDTQYVITSRFTRSNTGFTVYHTFGPYPTRSKAQTALKRRLAVHKGIYGDLQGVEARVVRLRADQDVEYFHA